jgi:hypothetical protein
MSKIFKMTPAFDLLKRALLIGVMILTAMGCSKSPTEALLVQTIDQMQSFGESRDVSGMMDKIADDFSGQSGSMDRSQLRAYLMGIRLRTQNIGVTRTKTDVQIEGTRAKVEIQMLVTDGGQYLPNTGQLVKAQTQWRFVSGQWQLASAIWEEGL